MAIIAIVAYIIYKQSTKSKNVSITTNDSTSVETTIEKLTSISITNAKVMIGGANSGDSDIPNVSVVATISVANQPSTGVLEILINDVPFKTFELSSSATYTINEALVGIVESPYIMTAKIGSITKAITIQPTFGA